MVHNVLKTYTGNINLSFEARDLFEFIIMWLAHIRYYHIITVGIYM